MSGKKYKQCCQGHVDWNDLNQKPVKDRIPFVTVRGRNLLLAWKMEEVLGRQLLSDPRDLENPGEIKKLFTPQVVHDIHQFIAELWPLDTDHQKLLEPYQRTTTGLYVGYYDIPKLLSRGVVRHCCYSDKILLIDPFVHPLWINKKFSPLEHPEMHLASTLRAFMIYSHFLPWIEAGLLDIIRTPGDFVPGLRHECFRRSDQRSRSNPDLVAAAEREIAAATERMMEDPYMRAMEWATMEKEVLQAVEEMTDLPPGVSKEQLLDYWENMKKQNPFYFDPRETSGDLRFATTGAGYDEAKETCAITGSYIATDVPYRWKELQTDHELDHDKIKFWSPFAKAFQEQEFFYLNNIEISDALELRKRDRLSSMRSFLRKMWNSASVDDKYSDINTSHLADELKHEVAQARIEWKEIDQKLIPTLMGGVAMAGAVVAGSAGMLPSASIHGGGVAAAVAVGQLVQSTQKRRTFIDRKPAGFFMKLEDRHM